MPRRRRQRAGESLRAFCACVLIYLGSYALLSQAGSYVPAVAAVRSWRGTVAAVDRLVWQPAHCRWYQWRDSDGRLVTDANLAGSLYLPLIAFDRARIHPTHRVRPEQAVMLEWRHGRPSDVGTSAQTAAPADSRTGSRG